MSDVSKGTGGVQLLPGAGRQDRAAIGGHGGVHRDALLRPPMRGDRAAARGGPLLGALFQGPPCSSATGMSCCAVGGAAGGATAAPLPGVRRAPPARRCCRRLRSNATGATATSSPTSVCRSRYDRGDQGRPRAADRPPPGVHGLLQLPAGARPVLPELRPQSRPPRPGGAAHRAGPRAVELEPVRQARQGGHAHAVAPGRRVLADPSAGHLHGLDRAGRLDPRERLPALPAGDPPQPDAGQPPPQRRRGQRAPTGAGRRARRRIESGRRRTAAGPDLAARRVPDARFGTQHGPAGRGAA